MITFKIKNFRTVFTFGFFFVMALTSLRDNGLGAYSLFFCIVHELGHLFVMALMGVKIDEIRFYGAGIKISSCGISALGRISQAVIYISGAALNLLLGIILSGDLRFVNLCLGIFNLLPVSYFDGGKLLELLAGRRIAKALSTVISVILTVLLMAAEAFNPIPINPSALVTLVFIGISSILDR